MMLKECSFKSDQIPKKYTRVLPLKSRYVDTWTSISKIRTAKAEFCGSKMSSALKEPRNSALAVLILEIDVHVSTYLLLSRRTLTNVASCYVWYAGTYKLVLIGYEHYQSNVRNLLK